MKVTNREQLVRLAGFDSNYSQYPAATFTLGAQDYGDLDASWTIGQHRRAPASCVEIAFQGPVPGQPDSEEATVLPLA